MKAKIYPGISHGEVRIPPSKSMAHRAIICASLADGTSHITNIDYSEDISTTISAMRKLGAVISEEKDSLIIEGIKKIQPINDPIINCNESGSTLRFLIPIFSLTNQEITFLGKNRLLKRPQAIYEKMFKDQALFYEQNEEKLIIKGCLNSQTYSINGNVSSQFISGLLFTLPLLENDSIIKIIPPFESKSYVALTLAILKNFNIEIEVYDELTYKIKGNQKYTSCDYEVEGDFSQFAFFGVLAAINNDLKITHVNTHSWQGDKQILDIFKQAQINFTYHDDAYFVSKSDVHACEIDLMNCPDLGPILFTLGMYGSENYHIYNAGRLRLKESDRIAAMVKSLSLYNDSIKVIDDEIFMQGKKQYTHDTLILDGSKDHRIVMALSVFATTLNEPTIITSAEAINKSYPNFFNDLQSVGIKVELSDD